MLQRPADWDSAQAFTGDAERLPPGGHICRIKAVQVGETKRDKKPMLILDLEIAEGSPYDGIFQRKYDARLKAASGQYGNTAHWPCVYWQPMLNDDGTTNSFFKGLTTSIEDSNPGYIWNFDERTLPGKLVGFVFGEEEFLGRDGKPATNVKPQSARSVEAIRKGVNVPEKKTLAGQGGGKAFNAQAAGYTQADDELPF